MKAIRKSSDAGSLHGVVNLRALGIGTRPIPIGCASISRRGPLLPESAGQVLQIGAHLQGPDRVPPNLPSRFGGAQFLDEPLLLSRAQNGLRRRVAPEILHFVLAEANRLGRVVVGAARVQNLERFLGSEKRKVIAGKFLRAR